MSCTEFVYIYIILLKLAFLKAGHLLILNGREVRQTQAIGTGIKFVVSCTKFVYIYIYI